MPRNRIELEIYVDDKGTIKIKEFARKTEQSFERVERASVDLTGKLRNLAVVFGSVFAGYKLLNLSRETINVAAQFERFQVALMTITGSAQEARAALNWIQDFAATTPYEINQVTEAFVRLRAYGLSGYRELRVLGDTAAALGKDLMAAVEMYADAIQGEFERLKEFGIRARQESDRVLFTFVHNGQQMVVEAEKTQKGIGEALSKIFEMRYAGGMEQLARTWEGSLSNIRDQWTLFKKEVAETGPFLEAKALLSLLLEEINRLKEEGKLDEWANEIGKGMVDVFEGSILLFARWLDYIEDIKQGLSEIFEKTKKILPNKEAIKQAGIWIAEDVAGGAEMFEDIESDEPSGSVPGKRLLTGIGLQERAYSNKNYKRALEFLEKLRQKKRELSQASEESAAGDEEKRAIDDLNNSFGISDILTGKYIESARQLRYELTLASKEGLERELFVIDEKYDRILAKAEELAQKAPDLFKKTFGSMEEFRKQWANAWVEEQDRVIEEWMAKNDQMAQYWEHTLERMQDAASDLFFDAMRGQIKSLGDLWNQLLMSMQRSVASYLGQLFTEKVTASALSGLGNWLGSLFSGGSTANTAGVSLLNTSDLNLVNGASFIPALAEGGLVTKPTLALVGESGPEAVIPLKNVANAPREERTVINHFVINAVDAKSFEDLVRRNPGVILNLVAEDAERNGPTIQAIRRSV